MNFGYPLSTLEVTAMSSEPSHQSAKSWDSFLWAADEWIVCYAACPIQLESVNFHAIALAVELYLKAAYSRLTSVDAAVRKSHCIWELWEGCKVEDSSFMPQYDYKEYICRLGMMHADTTGEDAIARMGDTQHYLRHRPFYAIAQSNLAPDLKYLGGPQKSHVSTVPRLLIKPEDYWIAFFSALRVYLDHPQANRRDVIAFAISEAQPPLPGMAIGYLRRLLATS